MHFELSGETEKRELSKIEESEEDRHQGKEVVDYWEDGLAIYADGTKEERSLDQRLPLTPHHLRATIWRAQGLSAF